MGFDKFDEDEEKNEDMDMDDFSKEAAKSLFDDPDERGAAKPFLTGYGTSHDKAPRPAASYLARDSEREHQEYLEMAAEANRAEKERRDREKARQEERLTPIKKDRRDSSYDDAEKPRESVRSPHPHVRTPSRPPSSSGSTPRPRPPAGRSYDRMPTDERAALYPPRDEREDDDDESFYLFGVLSLRACIIMASVLILAIMAFLVFQKSSKKCYGYCARRGCSKA